jgi:hypothetical protein
VEAGRRINMDWSKAKGIYIKQCCVDCGECPAKHIYTLSMPIGALCVETIAGIADEEELVENEDN